MSHRVSISTRQLLSACSGRLWRSWAWVGMQLVCVALLLAAGLAWTRLPEKHAWQVVLSLLIPVLLAAAFLLLQAATLRSLFRPCADEAEFGAPWVSLAWGAATLLPWMILAWLASILLDRSDDKVELWSGYLNSRFGAGARAKLATEEHIAWLLTYVVRTIRWVVVPGLLLPLASSAAVGLRRLPFKRLLRVWLNWRWWPAVLAAALIAVAWPQSFFATLPRGPVSAQVWHVVIKLVGAYLLIVASWFALLTWAATLLCAEPVANRRDDGDGELTGVGVRNLPPDGGKSSSVRLPLPESSDDSVGNA
jgi:hypothetical protein